MSAMHWSRRALLQTGALSAGALSARALAYGGPFGGMRTEAKSCIFLMLVGGPSHLDTWDPKPEAPSAVRGPFRVIRTNVPGIELSENFPRMAQHAEKYALVRSCFHTAAAVHDTGHQLVQTGRLSEKGVAFPHVGCRVAARAGQRGAHMLLGGAIGNTGGNLHHGQSAGELGAEFEPVETRRAALQLDREPEAVRRAYGLTEFGQSCLGARRCVEAGARFVTVNMYRTVFDQTSWDIHGARPFTSMAAHRDVVCPDFDQAYSALLADLERRGLLESTLVVATGEFGRSPKVNALGGRDHWTQCWTALFAGGGVRGGQVVGKSDAIGAEPVERPVSAPELTATIGYAMGLSTEVEPVRELFV